MDHSSDRSARQEGIGLVGLLWLLYTSVVYAQGSRTPDPPVLSFSPKVNALVTDALQNATRIAMLQPVGNVTDPNRPLTQYDRSEFFQLRLACAIGRADEVGRERGIDKAESDRVCDLLLVTAADQMRKGIAVDDPTHLLAPYLLSQRNRGYTAADGQDFEIAMRSARVTAIASRSVKGNAPELDTSDQPVQVDATQVIAPEARPKANPSVQITINTTKGGAKDSAFTTSAAYGHYKDGSIPLENSFAFRTYRIEYPARHECNSKSSAAGRDDCAYNGSALGFMYNDKYRKLR